MKFKNKAKKSPTARQKHDFWTFHAFENKNVDHFVITDPGNKILNINTPDAKGDS